MTKKTDTNDPVRDNKAENKNARGDTPSKEEKRVT